MLENILQVAKLVQFIQILGEYQISYRREFAGWKSRGLFVLSSFPIKMNNQIKCKCLNRPKFFCQAHKAFICHQEVSAHNCPLISIDQYIKRSGDNETEYALAVNGVQTRARTFLKTVSAIIDDKAKGLKDQCRTIEKALAKVVEGYDRLLRDHCIKVIEDNLESSVEELEYLKKGNGLMTLDSSFSQISQAKINKQNTEVETRLCAFIDKEKIYEVVFNYCSSLAGEVGLLESSLLALRTADLSQQLVMTGQLTRKIGLLKLQENAKFIKSYLESVDVTAARHLHKVLRSNISSITLSDAEDGFLNSEFMAISGRISFNKNVQVSEPFIKQADGDNEHALSKLYGESKKVSEVYGPINLEARLSAKSLRGQNNLPKQSARSRGLRPTEFGEEDLDFDLDEEGMGHSLEFSAEGIKQAFHKSLTALCQILDHALCDLNCYGFFDTYHRTEISQYLDQLMLVLKDTLVAVKNNFNKL